MTVNDEAGGERGKGDEQARTEGFICSRRRQEGGVYVLESLMSCLQQLVNKSEVRYVLSCSRWVESSDWAIVD